MNLHPKALAILALYSTTDTKQDHYIFPFIQLGLEQTKLFNQISSKTTLINKYLKKIATLAEINKPITTHIARHSFSNIGRTQNVNLYDVSKLLGHSSLKITENYLSHFDLDSQDLAHLKILDY